MLRIFRLLAILLLLTLFPGCMTVTDPAMVSLAKAPLTSAPWVKQVEPWSFGRDEGLLITTDHFRIYTTIESPLYHHMMGRVLEATWERHQKLAPAPAGHDLNCYVLATRGQWERHTRDNTGDDAPIYLQITSGGYSQRGVFAGYDIGFENTLSVIAHEAWHQYSWFAFKDRLPSWLEEGLATQNESIQYENAQPIFRPEENRRRLVSMRAAIRNGDLWKLQDLVSTHAGRVIAKSHGKIDSYYAQLWSFTLFLQKSPRYGPRLQSLLADAAAGRLTQALAGTSVTQREIANYTERWNSIAGPVYLQKYIREDLERLEQEYMDWVREFVR